MTNKLAVSLLENQIATALRSAESVSEIGHAGARGRLREIFVQDLIEPFLPETWGVSTGIVICSDGTETTKSQSGQEDILIYDPSLLPPLIKRSEQAVLPIEAVLAIVEVKSVLSASDYSQAVKHSSEIRAMPTSLSLDAAALNILNQFRYPLYHLYGFTSDISGEEKNEWDRLLEAHEKHGLTSPVLNSVCCSDTQLYTQHHKYPQEFKMYADPSHQGRRLIKAFDGIINADEMIDKLRIRNTKYWLLGLLDTARLTHATRLRKMPPVVLSHYFQ